MSHTPATMKTPQSAIVMGRRGFLAGLVSALAAPAIVRASALMPVKVPTLVIISGETLDMSYYGSRVLTINMITREAIKLWVDSDTFIRNIDKQFPCCFAAGTWREHRVG